MPTHPIIRQSLDKVQFTQLKGLKNLEIDFKDKKVTAIFGINGCGITCIGMFVPTLWFPG